MSEHRITLKAGICHAGCGAPIQYRTNSRVVCEGCKPARRAEQMRLVAERIRRKNGVAQVKGTMCQCARCCAEFVRSGIKRKFCFECQPEAVLERARATSKAKAATAEGRAYNNAWARKRRKTDPAWRINEHFGTLLHRALGKQKAGRSWKLFVPYTLEELMRHLERQFTPGMSWEKMGPEIHIDHIIPLSSFKFETPDDPEFKAAWALTNLRPLWGRENIRKSAKRTHLL